MIRVFLYLLALAALSVVAVWFADHPGTIRIHWQGYVVESPLAIGLLALVAGAVVLAALYEIYSLSVATPRRLRDLGKARRRERGYRALTVGLTAAAAGDAVGARRAAKTANGLLGEPPLTLLLTAQAAQLEGDTAGAKAAFRGMLEDSRTEFLGLRGLVVQAVRAGDTGEALTLVRRAHEIDPKSGWVIDNLAALEIDAGNWQKADAAVRAAVGQKRLDADTGRHRRAALIHQRALEADADGRADEALQVARQALGVDAGFQPAALLAAARLIDNGQNRPAKKLIERAWARAPHPDLARLYLRIAGADPLARFKAVQSLTRATPDHVEARLALAEAALDAALWGQAREPLHPLVEGDAAGGTARAFRLMARLAEGEDEVGNAEAARPWLERAASAPPDASWLCGKCGTAAAAWTLRCPNCATVDSLSWQAPIVAFPAPAHGVEMTALQKSE